VSDFRVLTTAAEWEPLKPICERLGRALPVEGSGVVFAEFRDGKAISFLTLQDAVFVEMIYAEEGKETHLRRLWNMGLQFLKNHVTSGRRELVTFTADDETGERIGHALEGLGCERLNWNLYRREI
jgi:hypothetical protein